MREMRNGKQALSKEMAMGILRKSEKATLALFDSDEDFPYAVVINPILIENTIYFHCANEGQKIDVLKKDNRVCLSAVGRVKIISEKFTTGYESVIVNSHSYFVEDKKEKEKVLIALCEKFTPSNKIELVCNVMEKSMKNTVIVALPIESISAKGAHLEILD